MSIQVRQTAKGVRYDVRMRTPEGRAYKRTFRTRKEAETFAATEIADRSRGAWVDPRRSTVTLTEWATEWMESNPAKRPSPLARDEVILRLHIIPAIGPRPLACITLLTWSASSTWASKVAPRTVRRHYDVLRALLHAAVEGDRLVRSPCRVIKLPARPDPDRPVITNEQLAALAHAVGPGYEAMVCLGALLGLR